MTDCGTFYLFALCAVVQVCDGHSSQSQRLRLLRGSMRRRRERPLSGFCPPIGIAITAFCAIALSLGLLGAGRALRGAARAGSEHAERKDRRAQLFKGECAAEPPRRAIFLFFLRHGSAVVTTVKILTRPIQFLLPRLCRGGCPRN